MTFEPYKKQARMTAFFQKQRDEQEEDSINETQQQQPASRTQVREEYQDVLKRIESSNEDDPWNVDKTKELLGKQSYEGHGDLSKLVSRTGGPTIQPRVIKKKKNNLDSAIAKMKEKCSPQQQKVVAAASSKIKSNHKDINEPRIKVATLRSDTSVSAKEFEKRLMERIKAKSGSSSSGSGSGSSKK